MIILVHKKLPQQSNLPQFKKYWFTLYGEIFKKEIHKNLNSKIWKDENHEIYFLSRIVFLEGLICGPAIICSMHYVVGDLLLCNTKSEKMGSHDLWE